MEGFENLLQRIESVANDLNKIKVGLEATGHYSYNILGFLLSSFPSASNIANTNLEELSTLLFESSKGRFDYSKAELIQYTAKNSIGSIMPAKSLEVKHTIKLIQELGSKTF